MIIFRADWEDFAVTWVSRGGVSISTLLICHFRCVVAADVTRMSIAVGRSHAELRMLAGSI